MLAMLFGALVAQTQGLPDSYIGIYADRNDNCLVMTSGSTMEYTENGQWGAIAGIYQAPNNDWVATWAQADFLTSSTSGVWPKLVNPRDWQRQWLSAQSESYTKYKAEFLGIYKADNARYTGEARIRFKSNSVFTLTLNDSKGTTYRSTDVTYLGGYDKIRVGGVYKDKYTDLNVTEVWGDKKWRVEGTFTHLNKKYNIEGERIYTRGVAKIIDVTNGRFVGAIIYGYSPTPSQMKAFRSGNFEPTDQVLVNFVVPGSPTVQVKALSR